MLMMMADDADQRLQCRVQVTDASQNFVFDIEAHICPSFITEASHNSTAIAYQKPAERASRKY